MIFALGFVLIPLVVPAARVLGEAAPIKGPACAKVRPDVRERGLAFDHLVYVENACDVMLVCRVASSVDPFPEHKLVVRPNEEKGVVTGKNKATRKFEPKVSCARHARAAIQDADQRGR